MKPEVLIVHIIPLLGLLILGGNVAGTVLGVPLETELSNYSCVFTLDMFGADFC